MMKKKTSFLARAAVMLLLAVLTATTAWASTFSGGDGSSGSPYQIANTADLNQLATDVNNGNTYSGKYFVLTDNITYTGGSETVSNYVTIGAHKSSTTITFGGKFDGQGHTISGIRIYKSGKTDEDSYQGLFGRISSTAEVKNVILADAIITGYNLTGGIVGVNDGGKVTDCLVLSDVTIRAVKFIASYHGGIAGHNSGTITGCTSAATLTDNLLDAPSYIYTQEVGGITGYNGGTVNKCFYLGTTLEGNKYVGAIAGDNSDNGGTITYSYFTSTSILGKDENGIELDNANSAVGHNSGTVTSCGLSDIPWTGSGSEASPYMIYTKDQLDMLAQRVNSGTGDDNAASGYSGKFFKLGADITYDYTGLGAEESNYTAIGGYYDSNYRYFKGKFDGQNHTVSGIRIYKGGYYSADQKQGLFGMIDSPAEVKNVILADATITGYQFTGGIVGCINDGTVEKCHVLSNVTVRTIKDYVTFQGGIAGANGGTVTGCTSAAALTQTGSEPGYVGGIVGDNGGTVKDCLYLGTTLEGKFKVGAIVGCNNSGKTVTNCYYTDTQIQGKGKDGGLNAPANVLDNDASAVGVNDGTVETDVFLAPQDTKDNTAFLALLAARNAALTAVNRTPALSTAVNVTLNGRTLYKDGKWNTICLPFNVDMTDPDGPLYGATYRTVTEASISGTTLNLTFAEKKSNMDADNTLIAGVPYIIKWNKATDYVDDDAHNIVNPVFTGVKINNVDGTYSNTDESVKFMGTVRALPDVTKWTWTGYDVLLMGGNNKLYYAGSGASLGAFRAYFLVNPTKVDGGQAGARLTSFNIDFGDGENNATGIISLTPDPSPNGEGSEYWYTLDGRRLQGEPAQRGIYVNNGKKVVIK